MAALIRQATRLCRQNVFFNLVGARCGSSVPPSKAPASLSSPTGDAWKSADSEVRSNFEGFGDDIKVSQNPESSNLTDEQIESYMQFVDSELGSVSGAHRVELLEELRGSTDPFDVGVIKQDQHGLSGAFDSPIIVPTAEGSRLVGCVCEEDSGDVVWMMIHSGEKKSCDCGNWFQAVSIPGARVH